MQAVHFCTSTTAESRVNNKILFKSNGSLGCCPFLGGGSVVIVIVGF